MAASFSTIADHLGLARREVARLMDAAEACYARATELMAQQVDSPEAQTARDTEVQALLQEQDLRLAAIEAAVERRDKLQATLEELRRPGRG